MNSTRREYAEDAAVFVSGCVYIMARKFAKSFWKTYRTLCEELPTTIIIGGLVIAWSLALVKLCEALFDLRDLLINIH